MSLGFKFSLINLVSLWKKCIDTSNMTRFSLTTGVIDDCCRFCNQDTIYFLSNAMDEKGCYR